MIEIDQIREIAAAKEQVIAVLLDHKNLGRFFSAKFSVVKEENTGEPKGGRGSQRRVTMGPISFTEEILQANDERICYRVVGNAVIRQHQGDIRVRSGSTLGACRVHYHIQFVGPWWLPTSLLKNRVNRDLQRALEKLAAHIEPPHTSTKC